MRSTQLWQRASTVTVGTISWDDNRRHSSSWQVLPLYDVLLLLRLREEAAMAMRIIRSFGRLLLWHWNWIVASSSRWDPILIKMKHIYHSVGQPETMLLGVAISPSGSCCSKCNCSEECKSALDVLVEEASAHLWLCAKSSWHWESSESVSILDMAISLFLFLAKHRSVFALTQLP